MENSYLEIQISDVEIPEKFDFADTKIRVLVDNRTVRDIKLSKLSTTAKTKLSRQDELIVFQIISTAGYGKEKEIDCLFIPTEFFLDVPISSTSTTGLPMRELESWLFFDENGYLKQQPQREGPKGLLLRLQVTEFAGSPRKSAVRKSRGSPMNQSSPNSSMHSNSHRGERRDRATRAPPPLPEPVVSKEVIREEVRHCDPASLIVFEEKVFNSVTMELKDELETHMSGLETQS